MQETRRKATQDAYETRGNEGTNRCTVVGARIQSICECLDHMFVRLASRPLEHCALEAWSKRVLTSASSLSPVVLAVDATKTFLRLERYPSTWFINTEVRIVVSLDTLCLLIIVPWPSDLRKADECTRMLGTVASGSEIGRASCRERVCLYV